MNTQAFAQMIYQRNDAQSTKKKKLSFERRSGPLISVDLIFEKANPALIFCKPGLIDLCTLRVAFLFLSTISEQ